MERVYYCAANHCDGCSSANIRSDNGLDSNLVDKPPGSRRLNVGFTSQPNASIVFWQRSVLSTLVVVPPFMQSQYISTKIRKSLGTDLGSADDSVDVLPICANRTVPFIYLKHEFHPPRQSIKLVHVKVTIYTPFQAAHTLD